MLTHDRDVGAVQRRHDLDVAGLFAQHLPRNPRARGVRDGIMTMQNIQLMIAHHLMHAYRQCQIVGRILEQRIPADIHFVEPDPWQEIGQAKRLLVGDEMHFVSARRERDAQFRGECARTTVRRIARDADLHGSVPLSDSHHAHACRSASGELLSR